MYCENASTRKVTHSAFKISYKWTTFFLSKRLWSPTAFHSLLKLLAEINGWNAAISCLIMFSSPEGRIKSCSLPVAVLTYMYYVLMRWIKVKGTFCFHFSQWKQYRETWIKQQTWNPSTSTLPRDPLKKAESQRADRGPTGEQQRGPNITRRVGQAQRTSWSERPPVSGVTSVRGHRCCTARNGTTDCKKRCAHYASMTLPVPYAGNLHVKKQMMRICMESLQNI